MREGGLQPLTILFCKPLLTEHGDYSCNLTIDGLSNQSSETVIGADGIQALSLAINLAKSIVENSEEYRSGKLVHDDGEGIGPLPKVSF